MRVQPTHHSATLDFEGLGRTLRLLDGDVVRVGLAFKEVWPPLDDDDATILLGGLTGRLRVPVSIADVPGPRAAVDPGAVDDGERAHLLIVGQEGIGEAMFAVSSAHFVGAHYEVGVLCLQSGPLLMTITAHREGADHA